MLKRLLNIALIFSLVLSVIGVSTSKVYCVSMDKVMEKPCCGDNAKDGGCCKEIKEVIKLSSDLSSVNAAIDIPNILLFAVAFLLYFNFSSAVLDKEHSFNSYNPPLIITDVSVLYQVFRI